MLFRVEVLCTLDIQGRSLDDRLKGWPDCHVRGKECCRGHDTAIAAFWKDEERVCRREKSGTRRIKRTSASLSIVEKRRVCTSRFCGKLDKSSRTSYTAQLPSIDSK